jgi:hypothetical protein
VVGREHRAEDGRDGVERVVREGKRLCVPLQQLDREPFSLRAPAAGLQQRGDVVDADSGAAVARRGDRGIAAASGDVEDAPARVQVGGVAEVLRDEPPRRRSRRSPRPAAGAA